jgi:hypothetical protein
LFAETEINGARKHGPDRSNARHRLDRDPIKQLLDASHIGRELNLGTILGKVVISRPVNLTRFEFYSAQF